MLNCIFYHPPHFVSCPVEFIVYVCQVVLRPEEVLFSGTHSIIDIDRLSSFRL